MAFDRRPKDIRDITKSFKTIDSKKKELAMQ